MVSGMQQYKGLDLARTYSIIGIVLMHVLTNSKFALQGIVFNKIIPSFTNLVFLFMMISAFGMCCGYLKKFQDKKIDVSEFYLRRYKKLWPFFSVLCILDLLLSPSINSLFECFFNLTLLQGLLPNPNISVIGVSWTLAVIFVFYLMFPFFVFLLSDKKRAWFAFLVSILMNLACKLYFFDESHVLYTFNIRENILYSGVFFMAGGLIYLYRNTLIKLSHVYKKELLIGLLMTIVIYYFINSGIFITLVLSSILLIMVISRKKSVNLFIKKFSDYSFEVYLSHMVIFRLLEKLHVVNLVQNTNMPILMFIIISMITLIGSIVFSVFVQKGLQIFQIKYLPIIKRRIYGR